MTSQTSWAARPDSHTTATSVDWAGIYMGTVPCASCEGIRMVLTLFPEKGGVSSPHYELVEHYLGGREAQGDATFAGTGPFTWLADGSRIRLEGKGEDRMFFIGEGFAELVGANGTRAESGMKDAYRLSKWTEYRVPGQRLLVDPASVTRDTDDDMERVRFQGLMDMYTPTQAGHKSLTATFDLDCRTRAYTMPSITYHAGHLGMGEVVDEVEDNDSASVPILSAEDVMHEAATDLCRAF